MKYIAVLDTDEIEDFAFFEDGKEKYLHGIDANSVNGEWIYLPFKPLEQEPRWISVKERLPKQSLGVLVWCPTRKNIYCAYYEEKQWWIFGAYWEKVTEEVVAWMPLPKPYKGESEE